nr:ROK family protein [Nocardia abscessus]
MGLNRSTILALTTDLAAAGLVSEELPGQTGRAGRPSLVVRPRAERVYVVALDVSADRLAAARVGLGGSVLDRTESTRPRGAFDPDDVIAALVTMARAMIAAAAPDAVCVGVGVAFCGMVREEDGVVRYGPNLGWVDVAFGAAMTRELDLGLRVAVGNNANLGALAERERGVGVGLANLIYLHGDVGIGGGIIVNGELLGGEGGYGGEVGHMIVHPGGRPCACGSRGCLEAEAGELGLIAAAGRSDPPGQAAVDAVGPGALHPDRVEECRHIGLGHRGAVVDLDRLLPVEPLRCVDLHVTEAQFPGGRCDRRHRGDRAGRVQPYQWGQVLVGRQRTCPLQRTQRVVRDPHTLVRAHVRRLGAGPLGSRVAQGAEVEPDHRYGPIGLGVRGTGPHQREDQRNRPRRDDRTHPRSVRFGCSVLACAHRSPLIRKETSTPHIRICRRPGLVGPATTPISRPWRRCAPCPRRPCCWSSRRGRRPTLRRLRRRRC